jgi:hypothetical protein
MAILSLQEMVTTTKDKYKELSETTQKCLDKGFFDYDEYNIFGTGALQQEYGYTPMAQDDANNIMETLKNVSLTKLIKEFLAKSSTTGIGGAAFLIPVKIRQTMGEYAVQRDIINDVSMAVIPAEEIGGATHDVIYASRGYYKPKPFSSGGKLPEEEIAYGKVTLDFTAPFGTHFNIGNDMIEDNQFNLIEQHVRMAGATMGSYSTSLVLTVMASTSDGDGTLLTSTGGTDTTTLTDVADAIAKIEVNEYTPDRFLACDHVLMDALIGDPTMAIYANEYHNAGLKLSPDFTALGLKWIRCNNTALWTSGTHATSSETVMPTNVITYVFCKDYSYISGRKRWLRLEHYSDPVRDLVGAVISARQDTCSLYDESVCKITEA